MSFQVYCSIPNQTHNRDGILGEVLDIIGNFSTEHNHLEPITLDYRQGHLSFDPNHVNNAHVVLIMHQNTKFEFDIDSLSNDSKKDYQLAKELGKKVFLLYRTKDGRLHTYGISNGNQLISGIAGTTEWFKNHLTHNVPDKKKVVAQIGKQKEWTPEPSMFDRVVEAEFEKTTKYIKTSGSVKPMYDRRLLI